MILHGPNMASNYKLSKAEFGLRSYSIALPGVPEDVLQDNSAHQVVKSRSFDLQPGEKTTGTSIKQKLKGWLTRGSSKNKTEKGEKRVNEQPATAHRESPLHKRLWLSGKTNDTPTEVEEAKGKCLPSSDDNTLIRFCSSGQSFPRQTIDEKERSVLGHKLFFFERPAFNGFAFMPATLR